MSAYHCTPSAGDVHRPEIHATLESLKGALDRRAAYQETFDAIEALLSEKGWSREVNPFGESEFTGAGDMLRVQVDRRMLSPAEILAYLGELRPIADRIAAADAFFAGLGSDLRHGGNEAFYRPSTDHIQMPPFDAFLDNLSYYSTLAHEHTHWTANAGRCDRELSKRFGDNAYAAEELIAELGAAFTCAHLGLSTEPREDLHFPLDGIILVLVVLRFVEADGQRCGV